MWTPFLLHGSLALVQVPSLFFCLCFFCFLLPSPGTWGVSCLLGGLTCFASVQWVFYRSSSTCRCISTVSVGRKVISTTYSSTILKVSSNIVYLLDLTPLVDPKQPGLQKWERNLDSLSGVSMHSAPCQSIGKRKREREKNGKKCF